MQIGRCRGRLLLSRRFDIEPHLQRRLRVVLRAVEDINRNAGQHLMFVVGGSPSAQNVEPLSRARFDQRLNMLEEECRRFHADRTPVPPLTINRSSRAILETSCPAEEASGIAIRHGWGRRPRRQFRRLAVRSELKR